jgi:hypothetical protein
MLRRSRSRRSERAVAALAIVAGCGGTVVGGGRELLEFTIDGSDGAAIVAMWEGVDERDELDLGVSGALTHRGPEPCPVAVYLHATQPAPEDMPTLTELPAPETAGELVFEGILLPPRDGVTFTTEIGQWDGETSLFHWPDEFHEFPPEPPTTRRWVTIATCADPDIDVEMELSLGISRPARPRDEGLGDASAAIFWQ